jgi:hypothetical protein
VDCVSVTSIDLKHKPLITALEHSGVGISDPSAITAYLHHHPDTGKLLLELSRAARRQLAPDTQLGLELFRSKEDDDTFLTLVVRQNPYAPDLLDRLDAITAPFDQELAHTSGWILLTTDYRAPE